MKPIIFKEGDRIGMLVGIRKIRVDKFDGSVWEFKCDCGNLLIRSVQVVKKKKHQSCGCNIKYMATTHGMSYTRIFKIWDGILSRCLNENNVNYFRYGAKGIKVCKRWLKFKNFYEDMKDGYADNLSIDRIKNNNGYYKNNCRWATKVQQDRNRGTNRFLTINGQTRCISEWSEVSGVNRSTLMIRIRMGWPLEKCIINKSFKPGHKFSNEAI